MLSHGSQNKCQQSFTVSTVLHMIEFLFTFPTTFHVTITLLLQFCASVCPQQEVAVAPEMVNRGKWSYGEARTMSGSVITKNLTKETFLFLCFQF